MQTLVKGIIICIFALVIFCRNYFPSDLVYWLTYVLLFALIPVLWNTMFSVSRKKACQVLGKQPEFDIFCARVPQDPTEDLSRGRLCLCDGVFHFIQRKKHGFEETWSIKVSEIKSVSFGTVAGVRKGFTIHTDKTDLPIVCDSIRKHSDAFFEAMGWKKDENV